eukprot:TRINITY_DN56185_c0_g1_i1.p2 TRINITY_DN56185_c0_g1~~TRINITY_DN56185_c0_g1_i1.p2  ORF type:complete len:143 (+),score=14.68 TRINITY_DN56185_c0_g1_i1:87-515(+)
MKDQKPEACRFRLPLPKFQAFVKKEQAGQPRAHRLVSSSTNRSNADRLNMTALQPGACRLRAVLPKYQAFLRKKQAGQFGAQLLLSVSTARSNADRLNMKTPQSETCMFRFPLPKYAANLRKEQLELVIRYSHRPTDQTPTN